MDQFIGEIRMFGGNYAPDGWAFCNGQLLPISEYEALFSLIGTTYGGDGVSTFAVPDFRGRIPVSQGRNPLTNTNFLMGGKAGTESVTLSTQQLPAHTHSVNVSSVEGTLETPSGSFFAKNIQSFSNSAADGTMAGQTIMNSGGIQPHDNMMAFLPISFIISLNGIYPQQG